MRWTVRIHYFYCHAVACVRGGLCCGEVGGPTRLQARALTCFVVLRVYVCIIYIYVCVCTDAVYVVCECLIAQPRVARHRLTLPTQCANQN